MFVYGGILMGLAGLGTDYCTQDRSDWSADAKEQMKDLDEMVEKADQTVGDILNSRMCSDICPCYMGDDFNNIYAYSDEALLNEYGRTNEPNLEDYDHMIWSADPETSFLTLEECKIYLDE